MRMDSQSDVLLRRMGLSQWKASVSCLFGGRKPYGMAGCLVKCSRRKRKAAVVGELCSSQVAVKRSNLKSGDGTSLDLGQWLRVPPEGLQVAEQGWCANR